MTTLVLEWAGPTAEVAISPTELTVTEIAAIIGPRGPAGADGRGITVSSTAPTSPQENDLWVDIS